MNSRFEILILESSLHQDVWHFNSKSEIRNSKSFDPMLYAPCLPREIRLWRLFHWGLMLELK